MKRYCISDPAWYEDDPVKLVQTFETLLRHHPVEYCLLRDKTTQRYETLARAFVSLAPRFPQTRFLLHADPLLAHTLHAHGVHLTSTQEHLISYAKSLHLLTILSTHTHDQAHQAAHLGADAITYSPIFVSPHKGPPKGCTDLHALVRSLPLPIFALGGIVHADHLALIASTGAYGWASIRYFDPRSLFGG